MAVIKLETDLPQGTDLTITKRVQQHENVPAYSCIGGGMAKPTREKSYPDLFGVLKNLSKNATWLFWTLSELRSVRTNVAVFKAIDAAESRKVTTAYKELQSLGIVLRVSRQHYLINPKVMLPAKGEYINVKNHWGTLTEEVKP